MRGKAVQDQKLEVQLSAEVAGLRVDRVVADWLNNYSRSRLKKWILDGAITVDGEVVAPKYKVKGTELLSAELPEPAETDDSIKPEDIRLTVHYSDEQVIVINKPAGMVMHCAPGNYSGTLQNALLYHDEALAQIPRAGIVHRLDKDTSGLVMIARNLESHFSLVQQLQERTVHRKYDAVVTGHLVAGGTVEEPIGRHPVDRKRMAVTEKGKEAVTHYRVSNKFPLHCHIDVKLETGRTHQIRVHMAHIHHALVGDTVYGRRQLPAKVSEELRSYVATFPRQALHARELGIVHPATGKEMRWQVDMPDDMQQLLKMLKRG